MNNPLFQSSLFYTPESWEDLQNKIESNYSGQEKATAYLVMMWTQNLCNKMVVEANAGECTLSS